MTERAAQAARSVLSARSLAAATASAVRRRLTGRRFTSARSARQIVTKPTHVASENLRFVRIDGVAHQGSAAR